MKRVMHIVCLSNIDDSITKNNADDVVQLLWDRLGDRPFDLTIRNDLIEGRPIVSTGLLLDKIIAEQDRITIISRSGSAGAIELDPSRYVLPPRIVVNHMRICVIQWLPHKIEWSILLR